MKVGTVKTIDATARPRAAAHPDRTAMANDAADPRYSPPMIAAREGGPSGHANSRAVDPGKLTRITPARPAATTTPMKITREKAGSRVPSSPSGSGTTVRSPTASPSSFGADRTLRRRMTRIHLADQLTGSGVESELRDRARRSGPSGPSRQLPGPVAARRRRPVLRDLPARFPGRPVRRRAASLLDEGPAGEPAPHGGRG